MKQRPENFEPPYPAFTSDMAALADRCSDITLAQIGVQYREGEQASPARALLAQILATLGGDSAPQRWERCTYVDTAGYRNDIVLAYWRHWQHFVTWKARGDVAAWADNMHAVGLWLEAFACPIPQLETAYSTARPTWGVAEQCPVHLDAYHGYFGSMRDRIAAAEDEGLPAALARWPGADPTQETHGHRLSITLPDNTCFIRTVQGWKQSPEAQQTDFLESMVPVYQRGVAYLRDNPQETNCLSARLVAMVEPNQQIQMQTLAWFLGLKDLERWAHEHPTHRAIFSGFLRFAERHNMDVQIVLGHEVYVVPAGRSCIEYTNCHKQTGLLRVFPAQPH